jgi:hypothetical protein
MNGEMQIVYGEGEENTVQSSRLEDRERDIWTIFSYVNLLKPESTFSTFSFICFACLSCVIQRFFLVVKALQQRLQTHCSHEAYCATLCRR